MSDAKIVAYSVPCASSPDELSDKVNALISEGWQPFGSISVLLFPHLDYTVAAQQPMVKYESREASDERGGER